MASPSTNARLIQSGDGAYWLDQSLYFVHNGKVWKAHFMGAFPFVFWILEGGN